MQILLTYVYRMFPYVFFANAIYIALRFWYARKKSCRIKLSREVIYLVVVTYLTCVVTSTIIPNWEIVRVSETNRIIFFSGIVKEKSLNLMPFRTVIAFLGGDINVNPNEGSTVAFLNIVGNVLLLMPLSFLLPIVNYKFRKPYIAVGSGLVFSLSIEIVQFFIGRSADIDDFILNGLGVIIGYFAFRIAFQLKKRVLDDHRNKIGR